MPSFAQDIPLLVAKERVDWAFLGKKAVCHHVKIPLYHGLAYAVRQADAAIPPDVLGQLAPASEGEQVLLFLLRKLVTETKIVEARFFLLWITQPGWSKLRWLKTALFPPKPFMKYRYGERAEAHPVLARLLRPFALLHRALLLSARIAMALVKPR